ncbi:FAD-binding oxidoreductase, partial [Pseudomonas sp. FW305-BF6]|uniref:FAD-dependent oxidoreductase n=1 Tax=Pseudomonas sp. FW305-BF6 TaxID=2070673 RepID=UPI000CB20AC4
IVGSGVSGAQSAYFLSKSGASVVVVDKRKIAHGSTIANTGLVQYTNDKPLFACIDSFGKVNAVRFYQLCLEAVKGIEQI